MSWFFKGIVQKPYRGQRREPQKLNIMKTLIQILFIFLILSLLSFSCTFGDKYVGIWKNIVNGELMTITRHKAGTIRNDQFEQTPDYDIEYKRMDYGCIINGNGDLNTWMSQMVYNTSLIRLEKTTGNLQWSTDEFEKQQ